MIFLAVCVALGVSGSARPQSSEQAAARFGGEYAGLDTRRRALIDDWVARFVNTTGHSVKPGEVYDDVVNLSTKTTFDAVTHALMTTRLTDRDGTSLGDALDLVRHVDGVSGEIAGARGDRQFRIYARLAPDAMATLARAREFRRGPDNVVYHKGYPICYRSQGGVPSIQVSAAQDGRRADIDVDYRSSKFPAALFNGHLTASNSDVRAGNNYDRHLHRWTGFQNWWRGFFGVRAAAMPEAPASNGRSLIPTTPRAGRKPIDAMVDDFLHAWLVEGDIVSAMSYISDRAYACLAQDLDDPSEFDRGMAPFQLMMNLKSAHETLGSRSSLDGLVVGTHIVAPALKVVRQPHHARFVVYEVPDDVAARFDCQSRLTPGDPKSVQRRYGHYFGATFCVAGRRDVPVALLWAKENGYWKIVSWQTGSNDDEQTGAPEPAPDTRIERIAADSPFVDAVHDFFESWLVRKDYATAFAYLSPRSYGCSALDHEDTDAPASQDQSGRALRAALEAAGMKVGLQRTLDHVIAGAEPFHPAIRVMDHPYERLFSLSSIPNALADVAECAARAAGATVPDPMPLQYGEAFGATVQFKTRSGDPPVLRLLWRRENGNWRITSYGVELP